jgi:ribonuclease BN (tRNA processing enzyme)
MSISLTVLGSAGTHPGRGRVCSSYLVESGGFRLLADCGNGSLSNLQRRCDVADVGAVVVSHLHPDHFADIYGLYYALRFHRDGPLSVPVYAPAGADEFISQLLTDYDTFSDVCRFVTVEAGDQVDIGPLKVNFYPANHPVEAHALRLDDGDHILTYTGDSAPTPALVEAARDADIFVADATWLETQRPLPPNIHMTGQEAGRHAAEANARRLVVTHVYPTNDPAQVAAEAAAAYDGDVVAASDLQEIIP